MTDRGDDAEHDREDAAYDGLGDGDEERPHLSEDSTVQYSTVYSTVLYSTVLYCTVQYSTVQYTVTLYSFIMKLIKANLAAEAEQHLHGVLLLVLQQRQPQRVAGGVAVQPGHTLHTVQRGHLNINN